MPGLLAATLLGVGALPGDSVSGPFVWLALECVLLGLLVPFAVSAEVRRSRRAPEATDSEGVGSSVGATGIRRSRGRLGGWTGLAVGFAVYLVLRSAVFRAAGTESGMILACAAITFAWWAFLGLVTATVARVASRAGQTGGWIPILAFAAIAAAVTPFWIDPWVEARTLASARDRVITLALDVSPVAAAARACEHDWLRDSVLYREGSIGPYYPFDYPGPYAFSLRALGMAFLFYAVGRLATWRRAEGAGPFPD